MALFSHIFAQQDLPESAGCGFELHKSLGKSVAVGATADSHRRVLFPDTADDFEPVPRLYLCLASRAISTTLSSLLFHITTTSKYRAVGKEGHQDSISFKSGVTYVGFRNENPS